MPKIEDKLTALGLTLPDHVPPSGSYLVGYRAGGLLFTSAVGPRSADSNITGLLGKDCSIEEGYEAARRTCLRMLTNVKSIIGDLDKVTHVVKVLGMVQATPEFNQYAQVVNGCSDLLVELYGDAGAHARSAVGMSSLPNGASIEIEMILEISE